MGDSSSRKYKFKCESKWRQIDEDTYWCRCCGVLKVRGTTGKFNYYKPHA